MYQKYIFIYTFICPFFYKSNVRQVQRLKIVYFGRAKNVNTLKHSKDVSGYSKRVICILISTLFCSISSWGFNNFL